MKILTALLITGILLIYLDKKLTCPPNKIEYRYLPRNVGQYINDASLSTNDAINTMKNQDGEEFYQVRVLLETDRFIGKAGVFVLRPGLIVDCSLIISNRSLMDNLLAPFISVKTKAFSENVWNSSFEQKKWSIRFVDLLKASFMN